MFKTKVNWLILTLFLLTPSVIQAKNPFVYLVKAFDCRFEPRARTLTGFRVKGMKGIVTALHGVADSGRIMVQNQTGIQFTQPLRIIKVDVERDLAFLSSAEIEASPADGFEIAQNTDWSQLERLRVIGHPYGAGGKAMENLELRDPPLGSLHDIVPPAPLLRLVNRKSPLTELPVVSLRGPIVPGFSGAPILNSQDKVVAVANGGLKGGSTGHVWAIPWQNINWQNTASNTQFQAVASSPPEVLFSVNNNEDGEAEPDDVPVAAFGVDENIPPKFPIKAVQRDSLNNGEMNTEVTIPSEGNSMAITTVRSTGSIPFCGRVSIWLLGKDDEVLDRRSKRVRCLQGNTQRREEFNIWLTDRIRNRIYSVAILHAFGDEDPAILTPQNFQRAIRIKKLVEQ